MPLDYVTAQIPLGGGVDQSVDPRVLPVGQLVTAENGWIDKRGAIRKRHGLGGHAIAMVDPNAPVPMDYARTLFSTGDELCMVGRRRLYAYDPESDGWHDRGPISPFCADQRDVFRSPATYRLADLDVHDGYAFYCAERRRQSDDAAPATDREMSIEYRAEVPDGSIVVVPTTVVGTATAAADRPHGPRVCHCGSTLIALWIHGENATPTANALIVGAKWVTTTPEVQPTGWGTITPDLYNAGAPQRPYDAVAIADPNWATAYIRQTTQAIVVDRRDASNAVTATRTLSTLTYERVTLAWDGATFIYVMAVGQTGGGGPVRRIELWKLTNDGSLTVAWGPVTLYEGVIATETVAELGCVPNGTLIGCAWTGVSTATGTVGRLQSLSALVTTGAVSDAHVIVHQAEMISRPFVQSGRFYVVARSSTQTELWEHGAVYDLGFGDANRKVELCGLHSIGTASTDELRVEGSANNAITLVATAPEEVLTMIPRLDYYLASQERRWAQADVSLDFAAAPQAAVVNGGGVVIGGGLVSWYAGARVEELGFATSPILFAAPASSTEGAGFGAGGVHSWQFGFESMDERGYWHRSLPSPSVQATVAAPPNDSELFQFKSMPASHRFVAGNRGREAGVVAYRADADGVFKRVTPPMRVVPNLATAAVLEDWVDTGYTQGVPLYTDSGLQLENVAPEGAKLVSVGGERVRLAGLWSRARMQYSKRLTPSTATESMIAPEFHEAFGKLVPSGEEITGLGDLDGTMALFTSNAVYLMAGAGPADDGSNDDFSPLTVVSALGCTAHRSVVATPDGIMYQGRAGIMLLDRGHQVQFVGEPIRDTLASFPTVTSAVHVPEQTQVRFTITNSAGDQGRIVVYDYRHRQWAVWIHRITAGAIGTAFVTACMHDGLYYAAESTAQTWVESATDFRDNVIASPASHVYVPLTVTTAWLSAPSGPGAWKRVRHVVPLCERKDAHKLFVEVEHDYKDGVTESYSWTNAVIAAWADTPREQAKVRLKRQKCQAVRMTIRDVADAVTAPTSGEGFSMAGIMIELGARRGAVKTGAQQRS